MIRLLFPRKCPVCHKLLPKDSPDLCLPCQAAAPRFSGRGRDIPYVKHWTALWYYEGDVRQSLLRFKFHGRRHYAKLYAPYLAQAVAEAFPEKPDLITYVPISLARSIRRGYDQDLLLARAISREMGCPCLPALRKIRNTPPQSSLKDLSARRANVLGAYRAIHSETYSGKRVLLLDDIITTGATISECSKTLLLAGAGEVLCASVAARR